MCYHTHFVTKHESDYITSSSQGGQSHLSKSKTNAVGIWACCAFVGVQASLCNLTKSASDPSYTTWDMDGADFLIPDIHRKRKEPHRNSKLALFITKRSNESLSKSIAI